MAQPLLVTEVPEALKRLMRLITRGFYSFEHTLVVDMLLHHNCVKEDSLAGRLKLEVKQIRSLINMLRVDKMIKQKMQLETDESGKTIKKTYYYINYNGFINVVKYKLDYMRQKIETQERDSTSRSSFQCPKCEKCFTDLEVNELVDMTTGELRCTYCNEEVQEEAGVNPANSARNILLKFNEQMEPIFNLLSEVESIKLAPSVLDPEPVELEVDRPAASGKHKRGESDTWSGDLTRHRTFNDQHETITVNIGSEVQEAESQTQKERPIWMRESTVEGAETYGQTDASSSQEDANIIKQMDDDVMKTLLAHEKKSHQPKINYAMSASKDPQSDDPSSTSESENEEGTNIKPTVNVAPNPNSDVDEMSDDEVEVTVDGRRYAYEEVTDELVQKMTPQEKHQYIQIGKQLYQDMYD